MRNRIYFIIYILATTCLFISVIPVVKFYVEGEENIPHLKTSALTEINSTILINDTPGSLVNR